MLREYHRMSPTECDVKGTRKMHTIHTNAIVSWTLIIYAFAFAPHSLEWPLCQDFISVVFLLFVEGFC